MTKYWKIAAGSEGRDYSRFFLKFGIAFVGGDTQCARMKQVEEGDIILLKVGKSIKAAGIVERRKSASDPADHGIGSCATREIHNAREPPCGRPWRRGRHQAPVRLEFHEKAPRDPECPPGA